MLMVASVSEGTSTSDDSDEDCVADDGGASRAGRTMARRQYEDNDVSTSTTTTKTVFGRAGTEASVKEAIEQNTMDRHPLTCLLQSRIPNQITPILYSKHTFSQLLITIFIFLANNYFYIFSNSYCQNSITKDR